MGGYCARRRRLDCRAYGITVSMSPIFPGIIRSRITELVLSLIITFSPSFSIRSHSLWQKSFFASSRARSSRGMCAGIYSWSASSASATRVVYTSSSKGYGYSPPLSSRVIPLDWMLRHGSSMYSSWVASAQQKSRKRIRLTSEVSFFLLWTSKSNSSSCNHHLISRPDGVFMSTS